MVIIGGPGGMRHKRTRISIDRPILLQLSSGITVKARIRNISAGGISVLYPAPAEMNAVLKLHFQLPDRHNEPNTIHCQGIVRDCHISQLQFTTCLEFSGLDEQDKSVVEDFIHMKLANCNTMVLA